MDIVTQGVLGAAAAQAVFGRRLPRASALIGFVAGLLADADVFIRPAGDPLGGLTYHRHFTHSLAFIPIGALIAALPFFLLPSLRAQKKQVYLCALVAYATHGLLDACTSYGTLLLWPFTDERIAWDLIAIIDPAFTVPLIIGILIALWRRRPAAVRIAFAFAVAYMGFAFVQHERAIDMQGELASLRGDTVERGRVIPTPLSLLLWRSIYETSDGRLVADGVHVPYIGESTASLGGTARVVTLDEMRIRHADDPAMLAGFERFYWFSDGYTAVQHEQPQVVGDMRYCVEPHTFTSLWGYFTGPLDAAPPLRRGQRMVSFGMGRSERIERVWNAMLGRDPSFQTLANVRAMMQR